MTRLFGFAGGCETGAEKPSLHDADGDGSSRFSGSGLHALSVRQDADTNGVADPGEVKSVRSLGITSIALSDRDDLTGSFEMNARPIRRGIGGRECVRTRQGCLQMGL